MSQRTPRSRRKAGLYVGCVLLVVGLSVLGYVGWQFVGTNVVAHRSQQQLVQRTETAWKAEARDSGERLGAQALIRIPRFGKDYVMPVSAGVGDDVLAQGFGHFDHTARPGATGNYALAAHRVTHGEPLRHMPELRPGDKVIVETRNNTYTYVLDSNPNDLIVTFHDGWVIGPMPKNPDPGGVEPDATASRRLITLTTCAELFHTDNRMIVFGHLLAT